MSSWNKNKTDNTKLNSENPYISETQNAKYWKYSHGPKKKKLNVENS